MTTVYRAPARFGWKLYFGLMAVLQLAGLPMIEPDLMTVVSAVVGIVGLVGMFAYAWRKRVPGTPLFWRGLAISMAVLDVIGISKIFTLGATSLADRPGFDFTAKAIGLFIVLLLSVPNIIVLVLYAREAGEPVFVEDRDAKRARLLDEIVGIASIAKLPLLLSVPVGIAKGWAWGALVAFAVLVVSTTSYFLSSRKKPTPHYDR